MTAVTVTFDLRIRITGMRDAAFDVRLSLRLLRRRPAFCTFAILILALGIGATTCIFSAVHAVLLNPLPFASPGRLASVEWLVPPEERARLNTETEPATYPHYLAVKAAGSFSDVGAMHPFGWFAPSSLRAGGSVEPIQYCGVTEGFFEALGAKPMLGRIMSNREFQGQGAPVAVLSYGLWKRRFGGRADAIGQTLDLDQKARTVIGVMPPDFRYDYRFLWLKVRPELWVPNNEDAALSANARSDWSFNLVARLKPGVSLDRAQAEMTALAGHLPGRSSYNKAWRLRVTSLHESLLGHARPALHPLMAAVVLLLAIACLNVANVLLAHGVGREREVAIRAALGAGRGRIARQHLIETLMLSLAGGALGLCLAVWGCRAFNAFCVGSGFDWPAIRISGSVLGFSLLVSLATGVFSGLVPALRISRTNLNRSLAGNSRNTTGGPGRHALSRLLVVSEVALSCVLLIGAGLLIRSFVRLWNGDAGIRQPEQVLTMTVPVRLGKFGSVPGDTIPWQRYLDEVAGVPGVESAAFAPALPAQGASHNTVRIQGGQDPVVLNMSVSRDYFRTLGIPLREGRFFTGEDRAESPAAAVVSETMARRYWPGRSAVGATISFSPETYRVVGVAADVKQEGLHAAPEPLLYMHDTRHFYSGPYLVVRTQLAPLSLVSAVRRAIRAVDPEVPVGDVRTLDQALLRSVASRRLVTALLGSLALAALALAAAGIFAVVSHTAKQRTAEMGIRSALGARPSDVLRLVLSQGLAMVLAGVALGMAGGLAVTRLLASQLYGVTARDPLTFAGAAVFLSAAGALACYLPAQRASRTDPVQALRSL